MGFPETKYHKKSSLKRATMGLSRVRPLGNRLIFQCCRDCFHDLEEPPRADRGVKEDPMQGFHRRELPTFTGRFSEVPPRHNDRCGQATEATTEPASEAGAANREAGQRNSRPQLATGSVRQRWSVRATKDPRFAARAACHSN